MALFRVPKPVAHKALPLIGAVSTGLLVAMGTVVADGRTPSVGPQAQVITQAETGGQLATPGSPAQFRLKEERDRSLLRLTDQLVYLRSVFVKATPGSPAHFRAHEEAESLRERLRSTEPADRSPRPVGRVGH